MDGKVLTTAIMVIVVLFLGAALLPDALTAWFGASTSGWSTSTVTMYMVVPAMALLAILIVLIFSAISKYRGAK